MDYLLVVLKQKLSHRPLTLFINRVLFLYTGHWTVYCVRHTAVVLAHTRNLRKRMGKEILDHG